MTHRPLDPRICDVAIDANAIDRDGTDRDALVNRLLALYQAGTISLILPKGVRVEIATLVSCSASPARLLPGNRALMSSARFLADWMNFQTSSR